jgi:two-component sensor histidine kinase
MARTKTNRADDRETAFMLALWEHMPHRTMLIDGHGRIFLASPAIERRLGYEQGSLRGIALSDIARDPQGRELVGSTPDLAPGRLLQLTTKSGHALLMRVAYNFGMSYLGESYQSIAVHELSEWGEDGLRWRRELEAITAVSSDVCHARDLDTIVQAALGRIGALLGMDLGVVVLLGDDGSSIRVAGHHGVSREAVEKHVRVDVGKGIMGIPLITGQPLLVPDLANSDIDTKAKDAGCRAAAAVPIIVRGEVLGSLAMASWQPKEFPEGAEDLLRMMGFQIGMAVDNARLLEREAMRARQLEAAVQELHHRVKNNLETLSAVLELARDQEGAGEIVDRLLERISAMAAVHGLLREGKLGEEADAAELVNQVVTLVGDICEQPERPVTLGVNVSSCTLPAQQATALALVTSELVSNALRHAFTDAGGEVKVHLECDEQSVRLTVSDNGKGIPASSASSNERSMGLQIVRALVEHSMGGRLTIRRSGGTRITVAFPRQGARDRSPLQLQQPSSARRLGIS